jgi:hypothetical protein
MKAAEKKTDGNLVRYSGAECPFPLDPPTEIISCTLTLGALKAA